MRGGGEGLPTIRFSGGINFPKPSYKSDVELELGRERVYMLCMPETFK